MPHKTIAALGVAAAFSVAACGENEKSQTASVRPEVTADENRYCALAKEMDAAGTAFFAKLEADDSATEADYEKAERDFLAQHAAQFSEIEQAAPAAIKSDITTLLRAQRERSGLETTRTPQAETAAAEKRVRAFEKREC